MSYPNSEKITAALKLLQEETTSIEKFESIRLLLKGISSKIDQKLDVIGKALDSFEKLQKGDVIELTLEALPENTEDEKRRKKAILFLIKNFKDLKSEIHRVQTEFESQGANTSNLAKIAASSKGPFGLVTLVAILIAGGLIFLSQRTGNTPESIPQEPQTVSRESKKIQAINFSGKLIPLSEVVARKGADCEGQDHYHAKNGQNVKALDGSTINDPASCAFGKVSEVKIEEVDLP